MRCLDTDKASDALHVQKARWWNYQLVHVARTLHENLALRGPRPLRETWRGVLEKSFESGVWRVADTSVRARFGTWEAFLASPPFDELFRVSDGHVAARLVADPERILARGWNRLGSRLQRELSVYWREGRIPLPDHTARNARSWDFAKRDPLPEELQLMSRPRSKVRIHDERLVYKLRLRRARNERRKAYKLEQAAMKKRAALEAASGSAAQLAAG